MINQAIFREFQVLGGLTFLEFFLLHKHIGQATLYITDVKTNSKGNISRGISGGYIAI